MAEQSSSGGGQANPNPGDQQAGPKKARWGRRVLIGVGVLVVLLVLLVVLIPTIASMAFVRNVVVGKVNENLNGRVAIDNWSLSWSGGTVVEGVSVLDAAGQKVVDLKKLTTQLSLFDAIKGRYDLGKVTVDGLRLNVVANADGTNNLQNIAKPSAPVTQTKQEGGSGAIPNIKADVILTDCLANVSGSAVPEPITAAFGGQINIPDINGTITDSLNTTLTIGGKPAGKVDLWGSADVFTDGAFDEKGATIGQKLNIQGLQLASVAPFVPKESIASLEGVTDGQVSVDLKGGSAGTLQGDVVMRNVSATGAALSGDTFKTDELALSIPATSVAMGAGLGDWRAYRVKTGGDTPAPIAVSLGKDLGGVEVLVDAALQAVLNAAGGKAPGSEGKVQVSEDIDVAALARMLPKTLNLVEGVRIQSGKLAGQTTIALTAQSGTIRTVTDLTAISAVDTRKGDRAVTIRPIHLDASAVAGGGGATDFRNLVLNLTSGFASASFKGQTLADLAGKASGDLKGMRDELGQVVDFGTLDLAGTFDMTVASSGNLAAEGGQGKVETRLTLQNLRVAGLAEGKTVDQKWANVSAAGTLVRGKEKFLDGVRDATVTVKTGDPQNPTIDVATVANVNLAGASPTVGFALQRLFVDAPRAQAEFAAFVPGDYRVSGGTLTASAVGTWSGGTLKLDALNAAPSNLTVSRQEKDGRTTPVVSALTMSVNAAGTVATGEQQTINLSNLNVTEANRRLVLQKVSDGPLVLTTGPAGFSGNGKLQVGADLAFVNSLVQAVSGQQVVATSKAGEVRSGMLEGTLGFDSASGKPTTVAGDFKIANLVVTTATGATQPETITLALQATAPADFSSLAAQNVAMKSRFANLNVTDALVQLKDAKGAAVGTYEQVQKANVTVDVPDVGALYTIASAFMPPAAAPAPGQPAVAPLTVSGGTLAAKMSVARNGGATAVSVSDLSGGQIQLRRGQKAHTVEPFSVQLAAALRNAGDQIAQIDVSQLAGKLGVADLAMEQPISIKDPGGEQMSAAGAVRLAGELRKASDLLAVVNGQPLPYAGTYTMVQKLNTQGNTVGLTGNVDVTNFQVLDSAGKVSFAEEKVTIANDVKIDQKGKNLTGNLDVNSKALGVKFNGGVSQFDTARKIADGTTLAMNYDAAKVWQIVRPMLSPETLASVSDLQVAGVKQTTFKVAGSYPANETFQQAITKLTASGALPLDLLQVNGITAQKVNPGFTLAAGKVTITAGPGAQPGPAAPPAPGVAAPPAAPEPQAQVMTPTAMVNGGTVDLTNAVIDLTTPEPTISMPANKMLAHNVALNAVLAEYANQAVPIFDPGNQSAVANVTVVRCDRLPLGKGMTAPNNGGVAEVVVSLTGVKPGGPVIGAVDKYVGNFLGNQLQATMQPTRITLANGQARIDNLTLAFGQNAREYFKLGGTVGLAPGGSLDLTANVPADLIKQWSRDLLKYLPQGVDIPIGGTKERPNLAAADKLMASLIKQAAVSAAASALSGNKDGKQQGTGGGGLGDILGNVIGGGGNQSQPQQQQQQQPPAQPAGQRRQPQQQQQPAQPQPNQPAQQAKPAEPTAGDVIGGLLNNLAREREEKKKEQESQQQQPEPAKKQPAKKKQQG